MGTDGDGIPFTVSKTVGGLLAQSTARTPGGVECVGRIPVTQGSDHGAVQLNTMYTILSTGTDLVTRYPGSGIVALIFFIEKKIA